MFRYILTVIQLSEYKESEMSSAIEVLESKREDLLKELRSLGEFRRGTVLARYRRCGKDNCRCAKEGGEVHPPQYQWTATVGGKTIGKSLHLGPEVEKYLKETERYKEFVRICDELLAVNEELCDARPVQGLESEKELEELKKKLQKRLQRKQGRS